jgi:tRNA(fMet)-specific endonuclease VapC
MMQGISIAFQDLLIGATALHLGFDVVTLNVRHFQKIPGLSVLSL